MNRAATPPEGPRRASWLRFFESPSGPVLITVLLGGIIGATINATVQHQLSVREQIRADEGSLIEARLEAVHGAFSLLGKMVGTAEDLIVARGPEYDLSRYSGEERKRVEAQLRKIAHDYNAVDRQWRAERYTNALLLAYYHPNQPEIPKYWASLDEAAADYVECARTWAVENIAPAHYEGECNPMLERIQGSIVELAEALSSE